MNKIHAGNPICGCYDMYDSVTDTFDLKKIYKLYDDFIENTMKTLHGHIKYDWVCPSQVRLRDSDKWSWESEEDRIMMAEELLNYGMWLPMSVNEDDDGYTMYYGNHRLDAIFHLMESGLWPESRKILIFIFPHYCTMPGKKMQSGRFDTDEYKLPSPVRLHIMSKLKPKLKNVTFNFCKDIDEDICEVEVDSYLGLLKLFTAYSKILGYVMTEYKESTGIMISPSEKINTYEVWKEWVGTDDNRFQP